MKRLLSLILVLTLPLAAHTRQWDEERAEAYESSRHGPDGALFLDPYFLPHLCDLDGIHLLDAGCGAGPWSSFAAQQGAHVTAVDLSPQMVERAREATAEFADRVTVIEGDVAKLPLADDFFDLAISINVGCNLPCEALQAHIAEIARVLRPGGRVVVTAPANLEIVFTGTEETLRATLVDVDGELVPPASPVSPGQPIWRKIPGLTVPNFYHLEEEYLEAAAQAGLTIEEAHRAHFSNHDEWLAADSTLGPEYVDHHPFLVLILRKALLE